MSAEISIEGTDECLFAEGMTIGRVVSSSGVLAMAVHLDGRQGGPEGEPTSTTVVLSLEAAYGLGGEIRKVAQEWASAASSGGES